MFKFWLLLMASLPPATFKQTQLRHDRVKTAFGEKEAVVKKYFSDQHLPFERFNLYLRAFKQEGLLEVWVKAANESAYTLLHTYTVCASSGTLGPKRREGDMQVPEGVYSINHFNPQSNFHLSLGLNYPNASDKILSDASRPGGQIYIHGNCVTVGCIPLTDDKIKELYVLAVEARSQGQESIPVHVFPARLTDAALRQLKIQYPAHAGFWQNLKTVYDDFEKRKSLRAVRVGSKGEYLF